MIVETCNKIDHRFDAFIRSWKNIPNDWNIFIVAIHVSMHVVELA